MGRVQSRRRAAAVVLAVVCAVAGPAAAAHADPTTEVNPFVGTAVGSPDFGTGGGAGATFPAAVVPFGMVQFGPDTLPGTSNFAGGYSYGDRALRGFSLTHFSGAGCAVFQDVPFLPTATPGGPLARGARLLGPAPGVRPPLPPRPRARRAGSYGVVLDPGTPRAIDAELTATTRTAAGRFRFPATAAATMLVNAGGSAMANGEASVRIDPARREVTGVSESGRFCYAPARYRVYFAARFDRPFAAHGTWRRQEVSRGSGLRSTARPTRRTTSRSRAARRRCRATRARPPRRARS